MTASDDVLCLYKALAELSAHTFGHTLSPHANPQSRAQLLIKQPGREGAHRKTDTGNGVGQDLTMDWMMGLWI